MSFTTCTNDKRIVVTLIQAVTYTLHVILTNVQIHTTSLALSDS